jgi:hypothetical protein
MRVTKTYSDEEKAAAVAAVAANNGNIALTARQLGVNRRTLDGWIDSNVPKNTNGPIGLAVSSTTKQDDCIALAKAFTRVAWKMVRLMPNAAKTATLSQLAVAAGIAVDKAKVLMETAHPETKLTTDDLWHRMSEIVQRAKQVDLIDTPPTPGGGLEGTVGGEGFTKNFSEEATRSAMERELPKENTSATTDSVG